MKIPINVVRDSLERACLCDPYLAEMKSSLSEDQFEEFLNHTSGYLAGSIERTLREEE
jgi:hypothetical protein